MFNRDWRADQGALGVGVVAAISVDASLAPAAAESPAAARPSVRAEVHDAILQITGTPGADNVALGLKPCNPSVLDVDVGDDGTVDFSFDRDTLRAINVLGGPGDDAIRIDESSGPFSDARVTLDGGPGNDTLTRGSGADSIDGGAGDDVLRGGDGGDVLAGGTGDDEVDGGRGQDTASLGSGDDRFTWDPGDGSHTVESNAGHDALVFNDSNASEDMDLSADSSHVHLFRDVGDVTMDLGAIETADINATGGADRITVNDPTGTGLQSAAINLGATPGGAGDGQPRQHHRQRHRPRRPRPRQINHHRQRADFRARPLIEIAGSESANDTLNINTLAGNDTASVVAVSSLIQPHPAHHRPRRR